MNKTGRLQAIITQIQTKKYVTATELADYFNVSTRTIYRDIRTLEEAGIPIGGEAGLGYYLVEGYHLPPVSFTREEAGALILASKIIDNKVDRSVQHDFNSALNKIKAVLNSSEKDFLQNIESRINIIHTNIKSDNDNSCFTNNILEAISERHCLVIKYTSAYNKQTSTREIEPQLLIYYGNNWHLIAYCKLRKALRDFRLDRIQELNKTQTDFQLMKQSELDKFFDTMIESGDLIEVKVWFPNEVLQFMRHVLIYFGFKDEEQDVKGYTCRFMVNSLDYMAHWLLSLGTQIKVIEPETLTNTLKQITHHLNIHYNENN